MATINSISENPSLFLRVLILLFLIMFVTYCQTAVPALIELMRQLFILPDGVTVIASQPFLLF